MKTQSTSEKIRAANLRAENKDIEQIPELDRDQSRYAWLEDLDVPVFVPESVKEAAFNLPGVFTPTFDNEPEEREPVGTLNGIPFLTHQNLTAIIAAPGSGKSSFCEAVCACVINPDCDAFGIKIGADIEHVLFFDCERTNTDVHNSFRRMHRRAGTSKEKTQLHILQRATIHGLRSTHGLKERIERIEQLIALHEGKNLLVILDGAGDLVENTNDLEQAAKCKFWIRSLTDKGVTVLTTLHPNKGTLNPRGHIGSEILRESEGIIAIQKKNDIHYITSDFEHGKNRGNKPVSGAFKWNDEAMMFQSAQIDGKLEIKAKDPKELNHDIIIEMLSKIVGSDAPNYSEFINTLKGWFKYNAPEYRHGDNAIKEFIAMLLDMHYVTKTQKGRTSFYRLHPDTFKGVSIIVEELF